MAILNDGQAIRDTYEVERYLRAGAFAEVYRVRHRFLGRQAMKVFKRTDMTLTEIEDMLHEAILLSRIGHPNIVRVYDANTIETEKGTLGYFTMEYIPGGSLDRFWQSHGGTLVPVSTTVELMRQVCRGMAVAHSENPPIIHRDIKPQNILIGYEADGLRARLSDFGLAKQVNPLTLLATAAGTLAFKPPETFVKQRADSCAADVWAIGVTLYLILTDQLPYELDPLIGWTDKAVRQQKLHAPGYWNPEVDIKLDEIVMRCLEFDPAKRFLSAIELLEGLENWRKPASVPEREQRTPTTSFDSKSMLGPFSQVDEEEGQRLAKQAIRIAKDESKLIEAADLMEEAFNKSAMLRDMYANQVRLWRRGISM